ncbi:uncharacterized protein BDZ99DRAFT_479926 [Mytilinidion resinicola]|uniref:Uncharacterized protein n=1 Tax=Mytilinidion resinicola TaxID=574789 RepID=A0A6A6YAQ7_9PEZI|nr:uncharacterized protein BDZ99DRAFT_479926 [Mytilinidion resinicola]KAF2805902.1 hypothetical protein BDZ99DRAFT_479926 [Mytilinidion resinicola]
MPFDRDVLREFDAELARVWHFILESIFENCVPYAKETKGGFLVSEIAGPGYELLTNEEDLLTFTMANQCDKAAHVLLPIVRKMFGDRGKRVRVSRVDVTPKRACIEFYRINDSRARSHTFIQIMIGKEQLVIDPTKAQFGFQECGLWLREFLKSYGVHHENTNPRTFTWEEHQKEWESIAMLADGLAVEGEYDLRFSQCLGERLGEAYDAWRLRLGDELNAVEVLSRARESRESFREAVTKVVDDVLKEKGKKVCRFPKKKSDDLVGEST